MSSEKGLEPKLKFFVKDTFHKCPKCGHLHYTLSPDYTGDKFEGKWRCFKCGFSTKDTKEYSIVEKRFWRLDV